MKRRLRPGPAVLRRIMPGSGTITWPLSPVRIQLPPGAARHEPSIRSTWLRLSEADRPKLAAARRRI